MINDVKHRRYIRPNQHEEIKGFLVAVVGMLLWVAVMVAVEAWIYEYSILASF